MLNPSKLVIALSLVGNLPPHQGFAAEIISSERERIDDHYRACRNWKSDKNPIEALERNIRSLRELALTTPEEETTTACHAYVNELLADFANSWDGKIADQVKADLKNMEHFAENDNGAWALNFTQLYLTTLKHTQKDANANIKRVGHIFFYRHDEGDWKISTTKASVTPDEESDLFELVVLRHTTEPHAVRVLFLPAFKEALQDNTLGEILDETWNTYHEQERSENVTKLQNFDFPKDQKIYHIRLFPTPPDSVIDSTILTSEMYSCALKTRYKDNIDIQRISFTDTPDSCLRDKIKEGYNKGVRFFSIDIANHGYDGGIGFKQTFSAEHIINIAKEYSDCKFFYTTVACYGGKLRTNLQKAFEEDAKLGERIALLVETKPDMVNRIARVSVDPDSTACRGSAFRLYMIQALLDPSIKTMGEAARYADQRTLLIIGLDPESLFWGELFSQVQNGLMNGHYVTETYARK